MANSADLLNTWNTIKEIDLRPLSQQAVNGIRITIVGLPGSGRSTLANQMRCDPSRPDVRTDAPALELDLDAADQAANSDLIILLIPAHASDGNREHALADQWANASKRVLVVVNEFNQPQTNIVNNVTSLATWSRRRVVRGSILDEGFLVNRFARAVIELVPGQVLGLARYFPLFRVPVAHYLINDTCLSNAAYSLSTGVAEIVPVLDIPMNMADMFVLTKTQAYLVYKLGLAFGFSTRWQDYVAEFGSVLGSGFIWRQLARSLVGLIPVYGIVPKVAVAYAGTYVVGNVILQWYLTGRHVSAQQMRALYVQAFTRGKEIARRLAEKAPRPRLPKVALRLPQMPKFSRPRLLKPRPKIAALPEPKDALPVASSEPSPESPVLQTCAQCSKQSASDATFCQYCGQPLK